MSKLHLGCGDMILEGYVNCDLYNPKADIKCDVRSLPFDDDSAEEVYASHLIEHFDIKEAFEVLKEWRRVLKTDGVLVIETPDLYNLCVKFLNTFTNNDFRYRYDVLYGFFFAKPWIEGEVHKFLYEEGQLRWMLKQTGFRDIVREPALRYPDKQDICLRMVGKK